MAKLTTINEFWEELSEENENNKLTIESADKTIKIIKRIIKAREDLKISQRELAKRCGIKQPALARIESFKIIPKLNTIIKIASCVNITIEAFNEEEKATLYAAEKIASAFYKINYITMNSKGGFGYDNR